MRDDDIEDTFTPVAEPVTDKPKRKSAVKKKVAKKAVAKAKVKKAVKKPAVKKAAKAKNGGEKRKRNGVIGKIVTMLKKGTTREALLKASGWKAISPQQIADGAGLRLKTNKEQRPFRYSVA